MSDDVQLKSYQEKALRAILWHVLDLQELRRHAQDLSSEDSKEEQDHTVVLHAPTGSGKTLIVSSVACLLLQRRLYDGVLVLTPTQDIREGFADDRSVTVPVSDDPEVGSHPFDIPRKGWIKIARVDVTDLILNDLRHPPRAHSPNKPGGVLAATYHGSVHLLHQHIEEIKDFDLSRYIVVVDEAHHVSEEDARRQDETAIARFTDTCRRQGALILMSTATPFRANGQKTYPDHARVVSVAYDEVQGAPQTIHIDLVGPKDQDHLHLTAATFEEMEGDGTQWVISEGDANNLIQRLLRDAQGRPHEMKCFLKVPRILTDDRLQNALKEAGFRVLNATGPKTAEMFKEFLESERNPNKHFSESEYDVVLVCGRGVEGTDWPLCHSVYHLGICQSPVRIQQLLGRTLRPKRNPGYPEFWKDRATLTFFVPNLDASVKDEVRNRWHARVILISCFIQDHQLARNFLPHVDLRIRRILKEKGLRGPALEKAMSLARSCLPNAYEMHLGARLRMEIEAKLMYQNGGKPVPTKDIAVAIFNHCHDPKHPSISTARAAILSLYSGGDASQIEEGLRIANFAETLIRRLRGEILEKEVIGKRWYAALFETGKAFDHITSLSVDDWVGVQAKIRGEDARLIAEDLRRRAITPTYDQVLEAYRQWCRNTASRCWPRGDLSPLLKLPSGSYSVSMLRRDLKENGLRGQPKNIKTMKDFYTEVEG